MAFYEPMVAALRAAEESRARKDQAERDMMRLMLERRSLNIQRELALQRDQTARRGQDISDQASRRSERGQDRRFDLGLEQVDEHFEENLLFEGKKLSTSVAENAKNRSHAETLQGRQIAATAANAALSADVQRQGIYARITDDAARHALALQRFDLEKKLAGFDQEAQGAAQLVAQQGMEIQMKYAPARLIDQTKAEREQMGREMAALAQSAASLPANVRQALMSDPLFVGAMQQVDRAQRFYPSDQRLVGAASGLGLQAPGGFSRAMAPLKHFLLKGIDRPTLDEVKSALVPNVPAHYPQITKGSSEQLRGLGQDVAQSATRGAQSAAQYAVQGAQSAAQGVQSAAQLLGQEAARGYNDLDFSDIDFGDNAFGRFERRMDQGSRQAFQSGVEGLDRGSIAFRTRAEDARIAAAEALDRGDVAAGVAALNLFESGAETFDRGSIAFRLGLQRLAGPGIMYGTPPTQPQLGAVPHAPGISQQQPRAFGMFPPDSLNISPLNVQSPEEQMALFQQGTLGQMTVMPSAAQALGDSVRTRAQRGALETSLAAQLRYLESMMRQQR